MAATLIQSLSLSGSRLSDGTVNAGGLLYVYATGTTRTIQVYSAEDASVTLAQPITLDSAGKADVYVTQNVDLYVETSAGVAVQTIYNVTRVSAASVALSGLSTANVQDAFDAADDSFGAGNFLYKWGSGAASRTVKSRLSESFVSLRDFGATIDGSTYDDAAWSAALGALNGVGGGVLLVPVGTTVISAAVAHSYDNITIRGEGRGSIVKQVSTTDDGIRVTGSYGSVENLWIEAATTSSGSAVKYSGVVSASIRDVRTSTFAIGYTIDDSGSAASELIDIINPRISFTSGAGNAGISILATSGHAADNIRIMGGHVGSTSTAGDCVLINSAATNVSVSKVKCVAGGYGVRIPDAKAASDVLVENCDLYGVSTYQISVGTTAVRFAERGNLYPTLPAIVDSTTTGLTRWESPQVAKRPFGMAGASTAYQTASFAAPGAATAPDLSRGNYFIYRLTFTDDVTVTLGAPATGGTLKGGELLFCQFDNTVSGGKTATLGLNSAYNVKDAGGSLLDFKYTSSGTTIFMFIYDAVRGKWQMVGYPQSTQALLYPIP